MHQQAHDFVSAARSRLSVLDMGSLNVNGDTRDLFPGWDYTGIDLQPGPGVDIVADAATWDGGGRLFDLVISCEALEHAKDWIGIVKNAFYLLRSGGLFIGTCAGPGRPAHKCSGEPMPEPQTEHYGNIDPAILEKVLSEWYSEVTVSVQAEDVRWIAKRK